MPPKHKNSIRVIFRLYLVYVKKKSQEDYSTVRAKEDFPQTVSQNA